MTQYIYFTRAVAFYRLTNVIFFGSGRLYPFQKFVFFVFFLVDWSIWLDGQFGSIWAAYRQFLHLTFDSTEMLSNIDPNCPFEFYMNLVSYIFFSHKTLTKWLCGDIILSRINSMEKYSLFNIYKQKVQFLKASLRALVDGYFVLYFSL